MLLRTHELYTNNEPLFIPTEGGRVDNLIPFCLTLQIHLPNYSSWVNIKITPLSQHIPEAGGPEELFWVWR